MKSFFRDLKLGYQIGARQGTIRSEMFCGAWATAVVYKDVDEMTKEKALERLDKKSNQLSKKYKLVERIHEPLNSPMKIGRLVGHIVYDTSKASIFD